MNEQGGLLTRSSATGAGSSLYPTGEARPISLLACDIMAIFPVRSRLGVLAGFLALGVRAVSRIAECN